MFSICSLWISNIKDEGEMEKISVFTLSSQVSNIFLTQTLKRELSAANVYEKYSDMINFHFRAVAPAETSANDNHLMAEFEMPLGIIPHQVSCYL